MTGLGADPFRRILEARRNELERANTNREAMAIEASPDELDRIQHASEREYAIGECERGAVRLREVRRALARIDDGTFGFCEACEGDINPKRLAAVPWASCCIACQEVNERRLMSSAVNPGESLDSAA